jgi:hypothetical protein
LARGRIFAERAASIWKTTLGGDSTQAIEQGALAQDPSKYRLYGATSNWKTNVDEVPQGLEPSDFEDWLWKREKPIALGRLNHAFPSFVDLPIENVRDPDFYDSSDTGTYAPRRHWCFLGEIMDFLLLNHLELEIKDISGQRIPLHFYTDGRGSELAPALVRRGYAVAVLYAKRSVFKFTEPGIRHTDPRMIKVRSP